MRQKSSNDVNLKVGWLECIFMDVVTSILKFLMNFINFAIKTNSTAFKNSKYFKLKIQKQITTCFQLKKYFAFISKSRTSFKNVLVSIALKEWQKANANNLRSSNLCLFKKTNSSSSQNDQLSTLST